MATQILKVKGVWQVHGEWGKRTFPGYEESQFYGELARELFGDPLRGDSVGLAIGRLSWDGKRWVAGSNPLGFDQRLRELRQKAGFSRYELAKRAGLTTQAVSNLEDAKSVPTWDTVCRLADALGIEVGAFRVDGRVTEERPKGN